MEEKVDGHIKINGNFLCGLCDFYYLCTRFRKKELMKNDNIKNQYRVNEQIRVREVRIVGDGGSTVVVIRALTLWRFLLTPIRPFVVSSTTRNSFTSRRSARRK